MNEFDLMVRRVGDMHKKKLLVQCYMINTYAQGLMDKKGSVVEEDMEKVTAMLFRTLGILK